MKIVADENIPLGIEFFSPLGEVIAVPPRELSSKLLSDADALVVRSVVRIDERLLSGSSVKFVGTCTAGFDHLDTRYFEKQKIHWASAPGCNANSVVQYVMSALARLAIDWRQYRVGIVGCGNVGGSLYRQLTSLGVTCCCYDPLLKENQQPDLTGLEDVLACDVISIHAPLTQQGRNMSYHLLDEQALSLLKNNAVLISAGRGAVVDNFALFKLLETRKDISVVLDVWEGEPQTNAALRAKIKYATPHIAGHSYDGKVKGTAMIYESLCNHLNLPVTTSISDFDSWEPAGVLKLRGRKRFDIVCDAILQVYDIARDDALFKKMLDEATDSRIAFDQMRKQYPYRREFHNYRVKLTASQASAKADLESIGFQVVNDC